MIDHFRLGYVGSPLFGDEQYSGRLTIPYQTVSGITSVRYRALNNEKPKYLSRSGEIGRPFNVRALESIEGPIFVTEGEFDCVAATQCGLVAIGFPGAQSWRPVFGRLLRHRDVVILCDGDDAGFKFGEVIQRDVPSATLVKMPNGNDVNGCLVEEGPEWLREFVGL